MDAFAIEWAIVVQVMPMGMRPKPGIFTTGELHSALNRAHLCSIHVHLKRSNPKSMKVKWSSVFIEFLSVVFAVLLALFLNAWRESQATEQTLSRVKDHIRQEIIHNDSIVQQAFDYRTKLLTDIKQGNYRIMAQHISEVDVDVNNDQALQALIRNANLFYRNRLYEQVKVERYEDRRVLILDRSVFRIEVRDDTISLYGAGNLRLRTADIKLHSWDIAQATGMLVQMDLPLVSTLSKLNAAIESYLNTSGDAIRYIYQGDQRAMISSMEDMLYFERQIVQLNEEVLQLLDRCPPGKNNSH